MCVMWNQSDPSGDKYARRDMELHDLTLWTVFSMIGADVVYCRKKSSKDMRVSGNWREIKAIHLVTNAQGGTWSSKIRQNRY